jgi:hypothetical protein
MYADSVGAQTAGGRSPDSFVLRGRHLHGAVTQDEGDISQAGFGAYLRFLPHPEAKPMFGQQFPDQGEACLILWQIALGVFLDFHDFLMRTPGDQNVRRLAMLCPFMMVFEEERLLLPPVRTCRGH